MGTVHTLPPAADPSCPPIADPLLLDDRGNIWIKHPFTPDRRVRMPLCEGLRLEWAPLCTEHILLSLWGGNPENPAEEALALTFSRDDLRRMIADLQSIDQQMDGA